MKVLVLTGLIITSACDKSASDSKATPATGSATPPPAAAPAAAPAPAAPVAAAPPPAPTPDVQLCSLISAADVGTMFGKAVVSSGSGLHCSYEMDPAAKQKEMDAIKGGDIARMARKGGGFAIPKAISEQLIVDLSLGHDTQTEDQVKAGYASIGKTVNDLTHPDDHGLKDTIKVGKDVPNVGEWAFATNVAAVNMGMGMSTRGRLLEAKQGVWRLTVSVTIGPDPGEAKLDTQLGELGRAVFAKLK